MMVVTSTGLVAEAVIDGIMCVALITMIFLICLCVISVKTNYHSYFTVGKNHFTIQIFFWLRN